MFNGSKGMKCAKSNQVKAFVWVQSHRSSDDNLSVIGLSDL